MITARARHTRGTTIFLTEILDKGQGLRVSGWGWGIQEGEVLFLDKGTPYRVTRIEYCKDPKDMWVAEVRWVGTEVHINYDDATDVIIEVSLAEGVCVVGAQRRFPP